MTYTVKDQYLGLKVKASFGTVATWPSPALAFNPLKILYANNSNFYVVDI
jgi:hypothetical protein